MASAPLAIPEVFSAQEIARAAGVRVQEVRRLIASARITSIDGRFVAVNDAVNAVRMLRDDSSVPAPRRELFGSPHGTKRPRGVPLAASGALHAAVVGILALVTAAGVTPAETAREIMQTRLVFLAKPGPGGGGGGGGLRQPAPPRRALLKETRALASPVPVRRESKSPKPSPPEARRTPPPAPAPVERPVEPPPPVTKPDPVPPVVAPVVSAAADSQDRAGVLADTPDTESQGSGTGGGAGSGRGTGIGEGDGSGIGPGSGGGTGGGPYQPGSGITAPGLLREVKPTYTDDARRRGIEGDVLLEIVVRRDGGVGDVRLIRGLGAGLDQRAIDAVRQWRFSPARRLGTPVDVMVEVAVEFRLR
jgi:protein TonB